MKLTSNNKILSNANFQQGNLPEQPLPTILLTEVIDGVTCLSLWNSDTNEPFRINLLKLQKMNTEFMRKKQEQPSGFQDV